MECSEKTPKMHEYEGKLNLVQVSGELVAAWYICAWGGFSGGVRASFIFAAKSFSEMFTTYSHLLPFCPATGLEIRNHR